LLTQKIHFKTIVTLAARAVFVCAILLLFVSKTAFYFDKSTLFFGKALKLQKKI
jgi:hypothetical protein